MKELELDQIYNLDCLDGMKHIPDGSIDAIICDLPYGTMKTDNPSEAWKKRKQCDWDTIIPTDQLFEQYERVLRKGGTIVLFSAEPYTSHLRTFKARNISFLYPMYWLKDSAGNHLLANNAPLSIIEDINVFAKANPLYDYDLAHPLRPYSQQILDFIGMTVGQVEKDLKAKGVPEPTSVEHFLSVRSVEYRLCQEKTYNMMIEQYQIDKMQGFKTFEELVEINATFERVKEHERTFNLPEGQKSKYNLLKYGKDTDGFHPTQKPVALIADLIRTYSNEGDTILDNCMGSGTTAVACIKEKRHFIGFELNKDYWNKACRRIDAERRQLSLF